MNTITRTLFFVGICGILGCGEDSPSSATEPDPEPEPTREPEALACAPLSDRAVAWYPGEGTAEDAIGDADGALDGPARYAAGYVGQAFDLGTDGAVVRLAEAPAGRRFTIEGWLWPSTRPVGRQALYGSYQTTLYLRDGRLTWWQDENAAQGPGEGPAFTPVVCMGDSSCDRLVGSAQVEPRRWTHVALTYDGLALRSYIDGELDREVDFGGGVLVGTGASPGVGLWARDDFPFWFSGLIDELTVYDRALSPGQVETIWNAGFHGKCGG